MSTNELDNAELELIKGYEALVSEYEDDISKAYVGFEKLKNKLAHEKNAPRDPAAVAAAIGRKKYGKKKFDEAAAEGHKMKKSNATETQPAPTTTAEPVVAAPAATTPPATAPAAAEPAAAPAPKLAPGLFQGFTLGSTLIQGPRGNVMTNVKAPAMDYQKQYEGSTKNQKLTSTDLKNLQNKK